MICAHLNSNSKENTVQKQQMEEGLVMLRKTAPSHHLISGGDINSFLEESETLKTHRLRMYPDSDKTYTTVKKRTTLQGQYRKSDQLVVESKDKIITSLGLQNGKCVYINHQHSSEASLIPSDAHPFDHFAVIA